MILINPSFNINHFKRLAFGLILAAIIFSNGILAYIFSLTYNLLPATATILYTLSMASFFLFLNSQLMLIVIYQYLLLSATVRYRHLNNFMM